MQVVEDAYGLWHPSVCDLRLRPLGDGLDSVERLDGLLDLLWDALVELLADFLSELRNLTRLRLLARLCLLAHLGLLADLGLLTESLLTELGLFYLFSLGLLVRLCHWCVTDSARRGANSGYDEFRIQ